MSSEEKSKIEEVANSGMALEQGTFEIIRNRLLNQGKELEVRLSKLNEERKQVFGAVSTQLLSTERVTTENNCVPVDMFAFDHSFLFGYNVMIGLKSEVDIADVFSIYEFSDHVFHKKGLDILGDAEFLKDFKNLYKYYKATRFEKFAFIAPHLFMVFRAGKNKTDIKTFKWLVEEGRLTYIDNRSDHEYVFPNQHEFLWKRSTRDQQQKGKHPHISIEDKVFVETTEGDLTIKIENNTNTGQGIFSEEVENKTQTLDDAEIYYAIIDSLVVLKIKPYQEVNYRYIVYNQKVKQAHRIDSLEDSCVLLPGNHGIIFANGYYLQTGELKIFDQQIDNMLFETRIAAPNGEDFLYVFFNKTTGLYILLSYNLIEQKVDKPVTCNGFALFDDGEMCYFKSDNEPKRHHAIQIWQTPYLSPNFQPPVQNESYLYKIGNKEIVRGMAECNEVISLIKKDESYANLYFDILKKASDILDAYYWIDKDECFRPDVPLAAIKEASSMAIGEYEKVVQIRQSTRKEFNRTIAGGDQLFFNINASSLNQINDFVHFLSEIRKLTGEVISLKDLRYVDLEAVAGYETKLADRNESLSLACVQFLLKDEALVPYRKKVDVVNKSIAVVKKVLTANELDQELSHIATELEMLIEIVGNLKIHDATETTRIIDNISGIYAEFNQSKAALKNKKRELMAIEGQAEFSSKMKLIRQGMVNYLDLADSPGKCDDFLAKIMVQLEELEGKFSEFPEYLEKLETEREESYNSFESKKVNLVEDRNRKTTALYASAERILKSISNKAFQYKTTSEINGYFASDPMIEKLRSIVQQLIQLEDSVKADDIQSRLKSTREEAVRQLKDKSELYLQGENVIRLGQHNFLVNTQPLGLTMVYRNKEMFYHLTGTNFFESVKHPGFEATRPVWEQSLVSENQSVYRAEYLAFQIFREAKAHEDNSNSEGISLSRLMGFKETELLEFIRQFTTQRYNAGYLKGVHDVDALLILKSLLKIYTHAGLLRFSSQTRSAARYFWEIFLADDEKQNIIHQLNGVGTILRVFPKSKEFLYIIDALVRQIRAFCQGSSLFPETLANDAGEYLFGELIEDDSLVVAPEAFQLHNAFLKFLADGKAQKHFNDSLAEVAFQPETKYRLICNWVNSFVQQKKQDSLQSYVDEVAVLIYTGSIDKGKVVDVSIHEEITRLKGTHILIENGNYLMHYDAFMQRLTEYENTVVQLFGQFELLKKSLLKDFEYELRLNEFKPRILSSFVRNRLINEVYLPIVGSNLAKQIGTAGEGKRTDLMGLLLLISPPGYGKTTLMEYIANRLGIIFMKINGPALGNQVVSLDPAQANNASSREELEKLSLAFEMGDNVMIYVDDIQHCNPEFLQKFISLCDAQRKIEGVYKGRAKTYDFKGKKVCVVMAGNPYTESGQKFKIPDMLANRADIYNLGDIIGDSEDAFKQSYIENSITSNSVLSRLTAKSSKDIYPLIRLAETGSKDGLEFEADHSPAELNEYVEILKKLFRVRDIIYTVNKAYIHSAAQSDEYRTEPAFKLQGSYRNMNKIAEKVVAVMNDKELQTLIESHYESESQTLSKDSEANLLKFHELFGNITKTGLARWDEIKATFMQHQKSKLYGGDAVGRVVSEMESLNVGLEGIAKVLGGR
ncbi:MAG: DNA repair ATPase [Bacteroidales bacterium]|nr:DNA repair ATPase [Bacteroidales bacterium]MCF8458422.1 DNA repair ATPase [Bacteroidales bacterium]